MTNMNSNPFSMKLSPILKWQGGKRKLFNQISTFYPKFFNNYIEPFSGAYALFTDLFNKSYINKNTSVFFNDINKDLIFLFENIKNNITLFLTIYNNYINGLDKNEYYNIKSIFNNYVKSNIFNVERSVMFFSLMQNCFNGVVRYNKKQEFNTSYGRKVKRHTNIIDLLNFTNYIFNNFNINFSTKAYIDFFYSFDYKSDDFFYIDPPYYSINKENSVTKYDSNVFNENDQINLYSFFKEIDNKKNFVLLSNSKCNFISNLYSNYKIIEIDVYRGLCSNSEYRVKTQEYLILGNYLYNSIK